MALGPTQRTLLERLAAATEPVVMESYQSAWKAMTRLEAAGLVKRVPAWSETRREAVPAFKITPVGRERLDHEARA